MSASLLAVAHGSRDPRFAANARRLVAQIAALRPDLDVRLAFLELSEPKLVDALADMAADGITEAVAVPLLLADAYHARIDLPTMLANAPAGLRMRQSEVLGADLRLIRLARHRVHQTVTGGPSTGVILAAVGSSDATANDRTHALADQLSQTTAWCSTATVLATGASQTVADAADILRARGATDIVVAPWFLAPGLLLDRVREQARRAGIPVAAPLGPDRVVSQVVVDRYNAAATQTTLATRPQPSTTGQRVITAASTPT